MVGRERRGHVVGDMSFPLCLQEVRIYQDKMHNAAFGVGFEKLSDGTCQYQMVSPSEQTQVVNIQTDFFKCHVEGDCSIST